MARQKGTVESFNTAKGHGFIKSAKGEKVFVRFSSVLDNDASPKYLIVGQEVEFEAEVSRSGSPEAFNVTRRRS